MKKLSLTIALFLLIGTSTSLTSCKKDNTTAKYEETRTAFEEILVNYNREILKLNYSNNNLEDQIKQIQNQLIKSVKTKDYHCISNVQFTVYDKRKEGTDGNKLSIIVSNNDINPILIEIPKTMGKDLKVGGIYYFEFEGTLTKSDEELNQLYSIYPLELELKNIDVNGNSIPLTCK